MANYRAASAGVWSALARWEDDGGGSYVASTVLPGATDVVYANNFNVTLDVDVVVLELRTTAALNVNAGGLFDFGAGNSVTANCFAGTTACVRNNTANAKFVVGNLTGGSSGVAFGVSNNSTGLLTIIGNITGGLGGDAQGLNITIGNVLITGNLIGGTGNGAHAVSNNGTGTVTINGTVTGGPGSASLGARNLSQGTIIVNGVVAGGGGGAGMLNNSTGTVRVTTSQGSTTNVGVNGQNIAGTTIVENIVWSANGLTPVTGFVKFDNTAAKSVQVTLENNTTVTLVDNTVPNYPLEADVEQGVGYGPGNIYTGTLVASISPQDIFTAIANSTDPIAVRLRNVSTVATTAATVASFDV